MAYETEYQSIIDALTTAKESISKVNNPELKNLLDRIQGDLTSHTNFLNIQMGRNVVGESITSAKVSSDRPLRILGREIPETPIKKVALPVLDTPTLTFKEFQQRNKTDAQNAELSAFKARLEQLYPEFRSMENTVILDQLNDLEIRGIAKWAGLPVTDNEPKKLDSKFIDQIKVAMNKKDELTAQTEGERTKPPAEPKVEL